MNNVTHYTIAFWFNILIANLWHMNDKPLLAIVFGIGAGRSGVYAWRVYRYMGFNFHAGINLPILGSLSIQTQPHMWKKQ
jgi:hypothetical protein